MKKEKISVYEIINERIISELEKGVIPWLNPYQSKLRAMNLISKKYYKGINTILLNIGNSFNSPYWLTFKQCTDLGGKIKKNEKSQIIIFWKITNIKELNKTTNLMEIKSIPLLRYYRVFNTQQCELPEGSVPEYLEIHKNDKLNICESIVNNYKNKPIIKNDNAYKAFYHTVKDFINIPSIELFDTSYKYYSTLFHELIHSTGHSTRLNRDEITKLASLGETEYSKEELVAEIGSAYLCTFAGIDNRTVKNSAAYIKGWLDVLKNDNKFLISAGCKSQKAFEYILGDQG